MCVFESLFRMLKMNTGLHLNPEGYQIIFKELMLLIGKELPEHVPEKLPFVLPLWDDPEAWQ